MFRAYDPEGDRLVAVKLFRLDLPPERVHQLVAEFEALIAACPSHPAIAVPIATGISGVNAYLVQEFIAAESLDVALRDGPLPVASLLGVVSQLAAALDAAAASGVDHGGVHPRDVLLSNDEVRLTGLGVARAVEKVGVPAPVRRPYTAPERVYNAPWDRHADIFSLAALVYEVISGRRVSGMGAQAVESLTEVPGGDLKQLRSVFARALDENPDERYDSAAAFADALRGGFADNVVVSEPLGSDRETPVEPPVRIRRSRAKLRLATPQPAVEPAGAPTDEGRPPTDDRRLPTEEPLLPLDAGETTVELNLRALDQPTEEIRFDTIEAVRIEPVPVPEPEPVLAAPMITDDAPTVLVSAPRRDPEPALTINRDAAVEFSHAIEEPSPPVFSALERSRSAMWPLLLALFVGVSLGFAGGYGFGTRDRTTAAGQTGQEARDGQVGPIGQPLAASPAAAAPEAPAPAARKAPEPAAPKTSAAAAPKPTVAATAKPSTSAVPGALSIVSRPAGARVFLDSRAVGSTPLSLKRVAAGAHNIRVERAGFRVWTGSVKIVPGQRARISASLEK